MNIKDIIISTNTTRSDTFMSVITIVDTISTRDKDILCLHLMGYTLRETGKELDMPKSTVHDRLQRVLHQISDKHG